MSSWNFSDDILSDVPFLTDSKVTASNSSCQLFGNIFTH
jgi:hypothetical protein